MNSTFHGFWTDNSTTLCYNSYAGSLESNVKSWCGFKDVCATKGLLLPLFLEITFPQQLRAFLYLVALLYSFMGVSIIADIFMCAIEMITSKTRKVNIASTLDEPPQQIEVPLWNGTVANLTLMALGSSAPEILLSIIEIIGNNFESGELGPGTIIGSAAFNMLFITAICIMGIPTGETRRIDHKLVFAVTSFFSVFAYIWMLVILMLNTANVIDLWEAVLTFVFFPLLVIIAYAADKEWFKKFLCLKSSSEAESVDKKLQIELGIQSGVEMEQMLKKRMFFQNGGLDRTGLAAFIKEIKRNTKLSDEDAAVLAASKIVDSHPHSRMWYRIGAVRNITGGRKTQPSVMLSHRLKEVYDAINEDPDAPNIKWPLEESNEDMAVVDFHSSVASVLENVGVYKACIIRHGNTENQIKIRVETVDGSAVEAEDYVALKEVITFESGQTKKEIDVSIVDDNQWEPDEEFFLKLSLVSDGTGQPPKNVRLGKNSIMEIKILNDDEPGTLVFEKRGHLVKETCGEVALKVVRRNGGDGVVSVKWRTIDKTAFSGKDFEGGEGIITFNHGECVQTIYIPIINDMQPEKDEHFLVELYEPSGGASVGNISRTAITIINDDDFESIMGRLMLMTNMNLDKMRVHSETWSEQIKHAMNVNGGQLEEASNADYVMHLLCFPFKVIFSLIPPPGLAGGWPCFFCSLGLIGLLTAIVGDLAAIFGCLVGLKDSVTAITFVALGTSLPDMFASKSAAIGEKTADNAIGNITGSNSVNVFLGLGLPWMIAAMYHASKGGEFVVMAGDLLFGVTIFTIFTIACILLLVLRRRFVGAELGGSLLIKYISGTFLICLWFVYIMLSSLQAYKIIQSPI